MRFKIGKRKTVRLLVEALTRRGWTQTTANDWSLFWGNACPKEAGDTSGPRTVNHFPGFWSIAHKGSLAQLLAHGRARAAQAGDDARWRFFPRTFEMPQAHAEFLAAAVHEPATVWIAKPAANTHGGDGQFLLRHPGEAPVKPGWLVQEYLGPTHLLDGRKYTLRVFLLLTSLDPLVVHIYTDGLVKRMTLPYSDAPEDRANRFLHLSNSDVQRLAPGGLLPRLCFPEYRELIESEGADYDLLWQRIRRVSILTMLAGRETLLRAKRPTAAGAPRQHNLWGLDIIVDRQLEPWVLECNGNPSMAVTTTAGVAGAAQESAQKTAVIEETLRMTGVLDPGPAEAWPPRRFGGWELLFPGPEVGGFAADWFPRRRDRELSLRCGLPAPAIPSVPTPPGAVLGEDGLIAYVPSRNRLVALNTTATSILFLHQEGHSPTEIAGLISAGQSEAPPAESLVDEVERTLARIWSLDAPDPWDPPEMEGEETPPPLPSLPEAAVAAVRCYEVGPTRIKIRFSCAEFAAAVEDVFAHLRCADLPEPGAVVDVFSVRKRPRVRSAIEVIRVRNTASLASALRSAMLHLACAAPGVITALHAGAVARGGRGLILAGRSGSGKTTLTAALCGSGFDYLSDEASILESGPHLRPAPLALGLTPESLPLLAGTLDADRLLPASLHGDGSPVQFLRPGAMSGAIVRPAMLVFPHVVPGAAAELRPIGPAEALIRLSTTGLELPSHAGPAAAAELIAWLQQVPRFELRYGKLDDAVAVLKTWIDSAGSFSAPAGAPAEEEADGMKEPATARPVPLGSTRTLPTPNPKA